ncbi:hypothetical protein TSOC_009860 [Tetrabaena socialis]|uniref:Uncharacterized protein n=1 Tax=Tetrabaena socialis TaxID=47790 RepID=A0A2J7ZUS1_9CHLO|nr:hypothetical protein TSOC_009860 [Tetrabaena socialis]|eukprot:PNH04024.1 hypothetical protein TSOC_009860 [Tetrabaena socialis]
METKLRSAARCGAAAPARVLRSRPFSSPPRRVTASAAPELFAAALLSSKLAFLPWNGCDVGGFYSTGQKGVPGRDCQLVYQPAAGAEARAVARLRQVQVEQVLEAPPAGREPVESSQSASMRIDKDALRTSLAEDLQQRNDELVKAAWQTLE